MFNAQKLRDSAVKSFTSSPSVIDVGDSKTVGATISQVVTHAAYRCILFHHLTPEENGGKHHLFVDILDKSGRIDHNLKLIFSDQWGNKQEVEAEYKPDNESSINIPIFSKMGYCKAHVDAPYTDKLHGLTTAPDIPDNGGNHRFHHSYYVVFMKGETNTVPTPPITPPITPPVTPPISPLPNLEPNIRNVILSQYGKDSPEYTLLDKSLNLAKAVLNIVQ